MSKGRDKCAVFGIYAPGEDVARLAWYGLFALQHRGQESSGIFITDGKAYKLHKRAGLVSQVFAEETLTTLGQGVIAIGHNRYSTAGDPEELELNAQPFATKGEDGFFAVTHNGNLVNTNALRRGIREIKPVSSADTELFAILVVEDGSPTWEERLANTLAKLRGAYSFIAATKDHLFGIRDPQGFRPLVLGRLGRRGWVLASETCALDVIGASFIREIEPGEVIAIGKDGVHTLFQIEFQEGDEAREAFCIFEFVYLGRPDSTFRGRLVHRVRKDMGAKLFQEAPVGADIVVPVPNSGISAAIGFAKASGVPYDEVGLFKNPYSTRTFIEPNKRLRRQGVRLKFNPIREELKGRKVIVIDDSIVRLTTMPRIVKLLRSAGTSEVHVRIASAPIVSPCFMGVDTPTYGELAASKYTLEEIEEKIGADSFHYLSYEGMRKCCGVEGLCTACFTGRYPIEIDSNPEGSKEEER